MRNILKLVPYKKSTRKTFFTYKIGEVSCTKCKTVTVELKSIKLRLTTMLSFAGVKKLISFYQSVRLLCNSPVLEVLFG